MVASEKKIYRSSPNQIKNLDEGRKKRRKSPTETRSELVALRMTKTSKKFLSQYLGDKKSLADLIDEIGSQRAEVIQLTDELKTKLDELAEKLGRKDGMTIADLIEVIANDRIELTVRD